MKILVAGNCQVLHGIGPCLKAMVPEEDVTIFHIASQLPNPLPLSDIVFLQTYLLQIQQASLYNNSTTHNADTTILSCPSFYYPGFHPDLVYCTINGNNLQSPLGDYNSALVIYGWLKNLSVNQTMALFCEPVFEQLSYFDYTAIGDNALIEEGMKSSIDMVPLLAKWKISGCFAYSVNHPKLFVCTDIAAALLQRAGVYISVREPKQLHDTFGDSSIWPLYPEIGHRLGIKGDYTFKYCGGVLGLEEFIERSFSLYSAFPRDQILLDRLVVADTKYDNLESIVTKRIKSKDNPYSNLPSFCYWRKAVDFIAASEMDLVTNPKFQIAPDHKIASAGSCFAQHFAKTLISKSYNYLHAELPPPDMTPAVAAQQGYGVFSARYGNIYTARQLVQLFQRAYGEFNPVDTAWRRQDGRFIDPFRPQINSDGYDTPRAIIADRAHHFECVRRVFEESDVFIFTAGLTEAWFATHDGAIFPVAPGVAVIPEEPGMYEFINFKTSEIQADLELFIYRVKQVNPTIRLMFTVSPVPLVATYEKKNAIVSTTYSKSALRAAIDEVSRNYDYVEYFPSYEIITNWYNRGMYFAEDYRSVTSEGIDHVMRLFARHYLNMGAGSNEIAPSEISIRNEIARGAKIVCDEELLDRGPTA